MNGHMNKLQNFIKNSRTGQRVRTSEKRHIKRVLRLWADSVNRNIQVINKRWCRQTVYGFKSPPTQSPKLLGVILKNKNTKRMKAIIIVYFITFISIHKIKDK